MSDKPREWWIIQDSEYGISRVILLGKKPIDDQYKNIHVIEYSAYEKAIEVLKKIDRWWDATNPERVVPAIDNPDHDFVRVRNDSMAAGSIIDAKRVLKELKKND